MKTPLTYGFISALGGALLTLGLYFAGFHESVEKLQSGQNIGAVLGIAILVTALALGMREKRANAPAETEWGYGSAFGTGVAIAAFSALFSAVFSYLYLAVINPNFPELVFQAQQAKMEAKGLSATQIANAEPMMRKFMSPIVMTLMGSIMNFIFGLIFSAIVAIFFRQPRPAVVVTDAPPAV